MWWRTTIFSVFVLAAANLWTANQASAQFYWHRDGHRMFSNCQAAVEVSAGEIANPQVWVYGDSGWVVGDGAASTADAQDSVNDGQGNSASAHALTHGQCALNPNDQAVMQWSFIHQQQETGSGQGDGQSWVWAWQGSFVDAQAVLSHNNPPGPTVGRLRVDYSWQHNVPGGFERGATAYIVIGSAYLFLFPSAANPPPEGNPGASAWGYDGYGNFFEKVGANPSVSEIGTFGIGLSEFTAPLAVGARARIWTIDDSQPLEVPTADRATWCLSASGPGNPLAEQELFQGDIEVWVDNP